MRVQRCPECDNTFTEISKFCPFCGFPVTADKGILKSEYDHIEYLIQQAHTWVDQGLVFPIVADTLEDIYRTRQDGIKKALESLPSPGAESRSVVTRVNKVTAASPVSSTVVVEAEPPHDMPVATVSPAPAGSGLGNEIRKLIVQLWKADPDELTRWGIWLSAGLIVVALVLLLGESVLVDSQVKLLGMVALSFLLAVSGWGLVKRNLKTVGSLLLLVGNMGLMIAAAGVILPLDWPVWQPGLVLGLLGLLLFVSTALVVRIAFFTGLGSAAFVLCGITPFFLNTAVGSWWVCALTGYSLALAVLHIGFEYFSVGEPSIGAPLEKIGRCGAWIVLLSLVQQPFGDHVVLGISWVLCGMLFLFLGRRDSGTVDTLIGVLSWGFALSCLMFHWAPWISYAYIAIFAVGLVLAVLGMFVPLPLGAGGRDTMLLGGTLLVVVSLVWGGLVFAARGREALTSLSLVLAAAGGYCLCVLRYKKTLLPRREAGVVTWLLVSLAIIAFCEGISGIGTFMRVTLYMLFGIGALSFSVGKRILFSPGAMLGQVIWMTFALYSTIGLQADWLTPFIGSATVICFLYSATVSGTPWLVFATLIPVIMTGYGIFYASANPWLLYALSMVISGWLYRGGAWAAHRLKSSLAQPLRLASAVMIWVSWIALVGHIMSSDYWSSSFLYGLLLPSLVMLLSAGFWVILSLSGGYSRCWYLAGTALAGMLCFLLSHLGVTYWVFYTLPWSLLLFGITYNDVKLDAGGWVATYLISTDWKMLIASLLVLGPVFLQSLSIHDPFPGAVQVVLVSSVFLLAGLLIRSRVVFSSGLFFLGLEGLVVLVLVVPFHSFGLGEMLFLFGMLGMLTTLLLKTSSRRFLSRWLNQYRHRFNRLIGELH